MPSWEDKKIDSRRKPLWRVIPGLLRTLAGRQRPLPKAMLESYLGALMKGREVFLESASRFGTPQYLFDRPALDLQIARFREAFSGSFDQYRVFYALKSNSFEGIHRRVLEAGLGLDVSSGRELAMALTAGCRQIIFSGPGKTDEELALALGNRDRVTLLMDSYGELERVSTLLRREGVHQVPLRAGIRVRSERHGNWNKFGVPLRDLGDLLRRAADVEGLRPCGIQFHVSWNLEPSSQVDMIGEIGAHIRRNLPPGPAGLLEFIDIGGGFWPEQGEWLNPQNTPGGEILRLLDPDFPFGLRHYHRRASPLKRFAREIAGALSRQGPPLSRLEVWAEPGRWICTPAMHILLRVVDRKDGETVITDGGTHLLGWERPLTEYIPLINLTRPSRRERPLRVFGSLCTPHDIWGAAIFGEGAEPGDVLLVPDQGAYTYSLRQTFIKPLAGVIRYDGKCLEEAEKGI